MRRLLTLCLMLTATAVAGGCGGHADETRSPGEIAFRNSCRSCHSLPNPKLKTDEEWPALVQRYGARARLTEEQIAQITAYLIAAN